MKTYFLICFFLLFYSINSLNCYTIYLKCLSTCAEIGRKDPQNRISFNKWCKNSCKRKYDSCIKKA